jgi:hypothetical protein
LPERQARNGDPGRLGGTNHSVFQIEQARAARLSHDGTQVCRRRGRGGRAAASATTDDGTVVYEGHVAFVIVETSTAFGTFT